MKCLVIGLGSMGQRRTRLLLDNRLSEVIGVDFDVNKCKEASNKYGIKTYQSISDAMNFEKIQAFIVSTSPLAHSLVIDQIKKYQLPIFTEINLDDKHISLIEQDTCFFVSSTMLYRKEINKIKELVKGNDISYNYHVGQYLPDWHPWQSYKDFFVAHKESNGCRELFAIELPWIVSVFGKVEKMHVEKRKISNLEIDYPDSFSILIKHSTGIIGTLQVDVVSRKTIRELHVFGENIDLSWNGTPETLYELDLVDKNQKQICVYKEYTHQEGYAKNIIEDAYLEELKNFINYLEGKELPLYSIELEKYILSLIDLIEGGD